jgi:hypothetical protein
MRQTLVPALICLLLLLTPSSAEDAASAYKTRYILAGFLTRATAICAKDRRDVQSFLSGLDVIKTEELVMFSKAFPKKIDEWMRNGASQMNERVMSIGIRRACAFARNEIEMAKRLAKQPIEEASPRHEKESGKPRPEYTVSYHGTCKAKFLNREEFIPCDPIVHFTNYDNHRSTFEFSSNKGAVVFVFEGGRDKQPDLENYELVVDKVRFGEVRDGKVDGAEGSAEGGCHVRMNKDASEFYEIKCDAFSRQARLVFNFYLTEITQFEKR